MTSGQSRRHPTQSRFNGLANINYNAIATMAFVYIICVPEAVLFDLAALVSTIGQYLDPFGYTQKLFLALRAVQSYVDQVRPEK